MQELQSTLRRRDFETEGLRDLGTEGLRDYRISIFKKNFIPEQYINSKFAFTCSYGHTIF